MKLTKHAIKRFRQRGFQARDEYIIRYFGTGYRRQGDAVEYRMTEKDRKRIIQRLDKLRNKAILIDLKVDEIITVYNID